jgi:hypothetical protein
MLGICALFVSFHLADLFQRNEHINPTPKKSPEKEVILLLKKFHVRSSRRPICELNLAAFNLLTPNLSVV